MGAKTGTADRRSREGPKRRFMGVMIKDMKVVVAGAEDGVRWRELNCLGPEGKH